MTDQSTRSGILPVAVKDLTIKISGEVGHQVDDYDLDVNDLDTLIDRSRAIAKFGMFGDRPRRLSAADEAEIDLAAASVLYVASAMGYEALLKLADETYRTGRFFLISGAPVLVASASGPSLAFGNDGRQLTIEPDAAKAAWDYWVDALCVVIRKNSADISNAQMRTIKTDLKNRWLSLVRPLHEAPVILEAVVSRKDANTFVVNGREFDVKHVSEDVQRSLRGAAFGEEKVLVEEIDADWVQNHSTVIRELGPFAASVDTSTQEGRQAFENAIKSYALMSTQGFREHLRGNRNREQHEAYYHYLNQVDAQTGEITRRKCLLVPVDSTDDERWAKTQLSARWKFVDGGPEA